MTPDVRTRSVLAIAVAGGLVVLSCVASPRTDLAVGPTASPTAPEATTSSTPAPSTVGGLHIYTVSELLDARLAGTVEGGPIALRGFWTERLIGHSCSPPMKPVGELELGCYEGEWGITERDESIGELTVDSRFVPASGPHLTPFIPDDLWSRLGQSEIINGQRPRPVPIVVVGHVDDPRAKDCQAEAAQRCADRFVVDRIVDYRPEAVPTPGVTPSPTPFPFDSPPAPPFDVADCAGDGPYSFVGWIAGKDLKLDRSVPTTAYAAITRDVIQVGDWIDDPGGSGHQFRTMGRRICFAAEWDQGTIGFAEVPGTAYRDWDDGHHTPLGP
jgi:hypothetical protein